MRGFLASVRAGTGKSDRAANEVSPYATARLCLAYAFMARFR